MKIVRCLFIVAGLLFLLTGCYENTTVVQLSSDGSGQIVISECIPVSMMREQEDPRYAWTFHEQDRRRDARILMENYEGVSLGSVTEIKEADGTRGTRTVYRFKDIRKLKLYLPTMLRNSHVTFAYTNGLLVVEMPAIKYSPERINPNSSDFRSKRSQFYENEKRYMSYSYNLTLQMPSSIQKTNASYPGAPTDWSAKNTITLVGLNLKDTLSDTKGRAKFMNYNLMPETYLATAKLLNGTPGVKYETNAVVNISVPLTLTPAMITETKSKEQKTGGDATNGAKSPFFGW